MGANLFAPKLTPKQRMDACLVGNTECRRHPSVHVAGYGHVRCTDLKRHTHALFCLALSLGLLLSLWAHREVGGMGGVLPLLICTAHRKTEEHSIVEWRLETSGPLEPVAAATAAALWKGQVTEIVAQPAEAFIHFPQAPRRCILKNRLSVRGDVHGVQWSSDIDLLTKLAQCPGLHAQIKEINQNRHAH
eukprot:1159538-Pelagomonas_calceolata.AAC.5